MNRLLFVAATLGVLGAGCKPATDLNNSCQLVKRNPDGGIPLPLLEGEVRNAQGQNKDFIAIGSIECEDLICVRDSFFTSDASVDVPAQGYCSRQCVPGTECPSFDPELDKGPKALRCRALLLSPETLAALTAGDGGFAGVRDPNFCARGLADGGM
ncbi:MAG: adventurous gliding motility lipoprotein CglC [Archangium sp.]|nr:adventurous gliding motility lipoprotein CglC [Archangium sp.]